MILDLLPILLVVLVAFDWIVVVVLLRASVRARAEGRVSRTLEDRGRTATLIGIATTLALVLGLNRYVRVIPMDGIVILLSLAVVLPSIANLLFLIDLWRGGFDRP